MGSVLDVQTITTKTTSNDIIAGNGRILSVHKYCEVMNE